MREVEPGHFVSCHFTKEELEKIEQMGGKE